jgi:hypothetical protein
LGEAKQKGTVPATKINDDMMKKVYAMAQMYMNYNADEFSSVWTKVVLPTIKSEMNLLRTRGICGSNQESSHSQ